MSEAPLVSIVLSTRSGSAHDPAGKEGLTRIAARYKTTVRAILTWNKGLRPRQLAAGDLLTVYTHRNND